jgi:hypothetical protein
MGGGARIRLTQEEKDWRIEKGQMLIGKFGKITADGIRECELIEEAARVFGKHMTLTGMITGLKNVANLPKRARKGSNVNLCEQFQYLVYVKDIGTSGFNSEEEVKEFLTKSGILGNVRVFKQIPTSIEYNIKLG